MDLIKPVTDQERESWPKGVKVALAKPFEDDRGAIQPLVDVTMESCVLITSKSGSVRANHFHKTDWHYCYVLSGEIDYYHRPTGTEDKPEKVTIRAGELFWTPPMVDHAMVFPQETVFLTFGRNSREQAVYEADVVRIPPINP
jgi:quercetin dioxygenase-like cupin family protein